MKCEIEIFFSFFPLRNQTIHNVVSNPEKKIALSLFLFFTLKTTFHFGDPTLPSNMTKTLNINELQASVKAKAENTH